MFNLESPSLLIIEDNPGDYFLIQDYLEEKFNSPKLTQAKRYLDADTLLSDPNNYYDIVLLDLTLPDKTGEDLINSVVSKCPQTPVIILTGFANLEFSIRSLTLRVSDYLLKDDITASTLYKSIIYNIERKKNTLLLEESEKRYSDLFQLSPQPMWMLDIHTLEFFQVNDAAIKQYGYSEEEFKKLKLYDIMKDDFDLADKYRLTKEVAYQPNAYKGRFNHQKKNGDRIDVDVYGNIIKINNKEYESAIAIDVTEKVKTELKVTKAIIKTQEDERYEIGTELHDNVCQILASSQLSLEMLIDKANTDQVIWIKKSKDLINMALEEIRNISHRLAPSFFDEKTMEDSFYELLEDSNPELKWTTNLSIDFDQIKTHLTQDIELAFFRITQEQIRNITKYANAKNVTVNIGKINGSLELMIKDDGVGFDPQTVKKGIGLANIRRRAELLDGTMLLDSEPGKGCTLIIRLRVD
jgi:PAS domain S-box-containing protein